MSCRLKEYFSFTDVYIYTYYTKTIVNIEK